MIEIRKYRDYPEDTTLPRHGMFRQCNNGAWEISLYALFKQLPKPRGSRKLWLETSRNMIRKLPDEYQSEYMEIDMICDSPGKIGCNTWVSARLALVMLTYGSRNHRHLSILEWVERYTGIQLPRVHGLSRREKVFGHKLFKYIDQELKDTTGGDYVIEQQVRLCGGRYYADFSIKHYWDTAANQDKLKWYLIEFDEEEHNLTASKLRDKERDAEIKLVHPYAHIIRVKHNKVDEWFELVDNNNGLIGTESALLGAIISACSHIEGSSVIINSKSAVKAYDPLENWNCDFLLHEKQPLRGLQKALERCEIRYERVRTKSSRQIRVSLESLSEVLHRWWTDAAAEHWLQTLKT